MNREELKNEILNVLTEFQAAFQAKQSPRIFAFADRIIEKAVASFRGRVLTDEEIIEKAIELNELASKLHPGVERIQDTVALSRWAIAESGRVCGPSTKDLVAAWYVIHGDNLSTTRWANEFLRWYDAHVKPIIEVEAPLLKWIAELESANANLQSDLAEIEVPLKARIAELEKHLIKEESVARGCREQFSRLVHERDEVEAPLKERIAELEKQLVAAEKPKYEVVKLECVWGVRRETGDVAPFLNKENAECHIKKIRNGEVKESNYNWQPAAEVRYPEPKVEPTIEQRLAKSEAEWKEKYERQVAYSKRLEHKLGERIQKCRECKEGGETRLLQLRVSRLEETVATLRKNLPAWTELCKPQKPKVSEPQSAEPEAVRRKRIETECLWIRDLRTPYHDGE
mgnify:CR=1 FL=1